MAYRPWGIPYLLTYEAAVNHEANVKPIRGDKNGTKPLGDRKRKYFNIRRDGDDVVVRMHSTDIARYKPDNRIIINNGGWASASTHDMFGELLRLPMWTLNSKAWVGGMVNGVEGEYVMPNGQDVTITSGEGRCWNLSGVVMPTTHKVNRKAANAVRKQYANFKRYLSGMLKVRLETVRQRTWQGEIEMDVVRFSYDEMQSVNALDMQKRDYDRAQNLRGMMLSDDTNQHYIAMLHIARAAYGSYYVPQQGILVEQGPTLAFFDKFVLFIHRDEVLNEVPMEGGAKRDPYGAWF